MSSFITAHRRRKLNLLFIVFIVFLFIVCHSEPKVKNLEEYAEKRPNCSRDPSFHSG